MMFSLIMQSNYETLDLHWHRVAMSHIELFEGVAWEVEIAKAVGSEASKENATKR